VTGTGAATKEQVQFMLTRLLRLKSVPTPSDAADGVAAALAYCMGSHMAAISARGKEPLRPRARVARTPAAALPGGVGGGGR
jgi:hypothetical protein